MNQLIAFAISQGIAALIEVWRVHANKPADWIPTQADLTALLALNEKTAEDYKREARQALSDPLPPNIPEM